MMPSAPLATAHTLVLLDAALPELSLLLSGLEAGCLALPVARDQDALTLLAAAVRTASQQGQLSPHWRLAVVAHGSPGQVAIGCESLNAASVLARSAAWRELSPPPSISSAATPASMAAWLPL